MKKIISMLLALCMIITSLPMTTLATEVEDEDIFEMEFLEEEIEIDFLEEESFEEILEPEFFEEDYFEEAFELDLWEEVSPDIALEEELEN